MFSIFVCWSVNVPLRRTFLCSTSRWRSIVKFLFRPKQSLRLCLRRLSSMGFVPIAKRRMTKRYHKSFSSATSRQGMNNMSSASGRHLAMRKPQRCPLSFEWHATIPERIELRETNQTLEAKTKLEDKAPEPSLGPRTESRPNGDVSTGCGQSTSSMKFGSRRRLCRRTLTISSVRSWHCKKCKQNKFETLDQSERDLK